MARFRLNPPKIKLSENDVETACLDLLRAKRLYPVRLNSGLLKTPDGRWMRVGEPGLPDYVIPAWFLEVKRPGGRLNEAQRLKIQVLAEYWDIQTAVVKDLDELTGWLARLKP